MNPDGAVRPQALAPGARVALVAPAGPLAPGRIDASIERCRVLGLEPIVYPGAAGRHRFMAGTDAARLADLQAELRGRNNLAWSLLDDDPRAAMAVAG